MPLTLDIYGSNPKNNGHLIINRNNLIITYYYCTDELSQERQVTITRDRFAKLIWDTYNKYDDGKIIKKFPESSAQNFSMTEDPRHDALDHMCSYDRKNMHFHLILKDDINFELIQMLFSNMQIDNYTDLISSECILDILKICNGYFKELETSATAQQIEADYRECKDKEFAKAKIEANLISNSKSLSLASVSKSIPSTPNYINSDDLFLLLASSLEAEAKSESMGIELRPNSFSLTTHLNNSDLAKIKEFAENKYNFSLFIKKDLERPNNIQVTEKYTPQFINPANEALMPRSPK